MPDKQVKNKNAFAACLHARAEELRALESAFRHQAEANQQVVQGLLELLREGR